MKIILKYFIIKMKILFITDNSERNAPAKKTMKHAIN